VAAVAAADDDDDYVNNSFIPNNNNNQQRNQHKHQQQFWNRFEKSRVQNKVIHVTVFFYEGGVVLQQRTPHANH
jgi:protein tyrosine phosphatase